MSNKWIYEGMQNDDKDEFDKLYAPFRAVMTKGQFLKELERIRIQHDKRKD